MASELVIHDENAHEHFDSPTHAKGLVPRDFAAQPYGKMHARAFDLPLMTPQEVADRLAAKIATKSQLSDIRNGGMNGKPIPSRDQNGKGYCWMHSGTSAGLILRAAQGEPYADLSAYAGACIIKNYRDEGGNGIDGVEFMAKIGLPTSEFWPQKSMSRLNDTPAMRANAGLHKFTEWVDLDPDQMYEQWTTSVSRNDPTVTDLNWWSHSVLTLDLVDAASQRQNTRMSTGKLASYAEFCKLWDVDSGRLGSRIWNSWDDVWQDNGTGILTPSKALPDNAVALRNMTPSIN